MAHKENQKAFVVTFPLHTEKWQEDRIDKMMRMLTTFYNDRKENLFVVTFTFRILRHTKKRRIKVLWPLKTI